MARGALKRRAVYTQGKPKHTSCQPTINIADFVMTFACDEGTRYKFLQTKSMKGDVYGRLLNGIGILLYTRHSITHAKKTNILYLHNVKNYAPSRHSLHVINTMSRYCYTLWAGIHPVWGQRSHYEPQKQVTKGIPPFTTKISPPHGNLYLCTAFSGLG